MTRVLAHGHALVTALEGGPVSRAAGKRQDKCSLDYPQDARRHRNAEGSSELCNFVPICVYSVTPNTQACDTGTGGRRHQLEVGHRYTRNLTLTIKTTTAGISPLHCPFVTLLIAVSASTRPSHSWSSSFFTATAITKAINWKNAYATMRVPPASARGLTPQHRSDAGRNRANIWTAIAIDAHPTAMVCVTTRALSGKDRRTEIAKRQRR